MDFLSDNAYGAAPEILAAVIAANAGTAAPYGNDELTQRVGAAIGRLFAREVAVFPVGTGTAANALALATLCPPHGAILCHQHAHIVVDECGAPGFFTHGATLVPIAGEHGKLTPAAIAGTLARFEPGNVHSAQPAVISLTQATECGTVYTPDEIAAIGALARRHGLKLHVDGARFANALAHLDCAPADATWRAGVDALSFGATKNGALGAEAVIFFDPADAGDFVYRRKKAGHLVSKMRLVSAQLAAYLEDGLWLALAARANARALRLAEGIAGVAGAELAHPVQANTVFVSLPDATVVRLRAAGAVFYDWTPPADGRTLARFVVSFATPEDDIGRLICVARG
jgi:threonine aldolase